MKLSTKGRYGLRALIDLAQNGGEQPVSITSISTRQDISERYLEPVDCAGLEPNGGCSVSDSCVTKYVWKKINDSINQTVDEIKLDQLVKENGKNCRN